VAVPLRDELPTRRPPVVTWLLIAVNTAVFLFLQPPPFQGGAVDIDTRRLDPAEEREAMEFVYRFGVVPCEIEHGEPLADHPDCDGEPEAAPEGKNVWLSLLTHQFLHGSVAHLVGNLLFLWVFGRKVEDRMGPLAYPAFYLVTGVLAMAGWSLANRGDVTPAVGASGAIAGVMGAYLVLHPRSRVLTFVPGVVTQVVWVPAFVLLGLFFLTQFFTPEITQVAWEAHVTGMVAGALLAVAIWRGGGTEPPAALLTGPSPWPDEGRRRRVAGDAGGALVDYVLAVAIVAVACVLAAVAISGQSR
jgi:membrane associated rhomboid family serine protease